MIDIPDASNATEAALRESEARFRGAFDHAFIGMAITSPEGGRWLRVNRALCEILGYDEDELLGRTFASLTHPDDLAGNLAVRQRALAGEIDRYQFEKRYIHKTGRIVWATLSASIVRDPNGTPLYFVAQLQDITERKLAEAALRESEARIAGISANVPGMVYEFVYRPDGTRGFTYASEGARTLFGIEPEALLRDPEAVFGLVHPEDRPSMHATGAAAVAALAPWRWRGRAVLASGEIRWIEAASHNVRHPDGSIYADGVLLDITELHETTRRLAESEQRYRSLVDHNRDAVYSLDTEGHILGANAASEAVSGYTPEELKGMSFGPLVDPGDMEMVRRRFQAAVAGEASSFETHIRHRDGHRVALSVTNVPTVVDGRVVGVFGIARDLTAQRTLEQQLRQAQKLEAIGRLAGGVAHDFNNLLLVIQSYTRFAADQLPEHSPARLDLVEVRNAAERATALTGQLLAFSRQQVLRPSRLDVNTVVSQLAAMLRRLIGEDVRLETVLSAAPCAVHADPGQLEQVLLNLAVNARDAMPAGGTLTLRTCVTRVQAERAGRLPPGEYVAMSVEDTGVGIAPEALPKIFEPFYTTKEIGRGTGLGLATVYGIVQQSGGDVTVESVPGRGTRFVVLLPRIEPEAERVADPATADRAGTAGEPSARDAGTILLVEDEATVRAAIRRQLERLGYTVLEAADGLQALALVDDLGPQVDVVLTDVVMPELGGRALGEALAERAPSLGIVYMSGYPDGEEAGRQRLGTGSHFLSKPFTTETLARAVRSACEARTPQH